MTLLNRELVSSEKNVWLRIFSHIVKNCPYMRNLSKIFPAQDHRYWVRQLYNAFRSTLIHQQSSHTVQYITIQFTSGQLCLELKTR